MGSAQYNRENTTTQIMKLNNKTDADIIQKLQEVPNKQGYIKALIRADIDKPKEMIFDDIGRASTKLHIRGNVRRGLRSPADLLYEHIFGEIKARKLDYVDNTDQGGGLYFFDVRLAEELKKLGYKVYFEEAGTKNTDGLPAWYVEF